MVKLPFGLYIRLPRYKQPERVIEARWMPRRFSTDLNGNVMPPSGGRQKFGDVDMVLLVASPVHADCVSGKATHASSIPTVAAW